MGLDIYGHLVKDARSSNDSGLKTFEEYMTILNERAKQRFHEFAVVSLERLEKVVGDSAKYEEEYKDIFSHMADFTKYEWKYSKMMEDVKSLDEVKDFFINFETFYYADSDVYFRKVNFVYRYFSDKLEDECCFADKNDIEELISRCDKVLADHSLAEELLPTTSGFFFGSTDYDEWYFKDVENCKKQMEDLLSKYNEETDVIFFVMSW